MSTSKFNVHRTNQSNTGFLYAITAYTIWGLVPLYWPFLEPAEPIEILAARVIFTFFFIGIYLAIKRDWGWIRTLNKKTISLIAIASILLTLNQGIYIYAISIEEVVQTSLGYFISPLLTIALGIIFLKEKLSPMQYIAVISCFIGILIMFFAKTPWIALSLAISFSLYGLVRKNIHLNAPQGLFIETGILVIPTCIYFVYIQTTSFGSFFTLGTSHSLWLISSGLVTAAPLLTFAAATVRIPLVWIGILQFIGPTLQYIIGIAFFNEILQPAQWVGFSIIWVAIIILSADTITHIRNNNRIVFERPT